MATGRRTAASEVALSLCIIRDLLKTRLDLEEKKLRFDRGRGLAVCAEHPDAAVQICGFALHRLVHGKIDLVFADRKSVDPDKDAFLINPVIRLGHQGTDHLLAAVGDLDGDNTTDFASIDSSKYLNACRYSGGYTCPVGDALAFNLQVTAGVSALASGSTTQNRALIAVASQDSKLYRCFYLRSPATAQPCVQVAGFAEQAKTLLVQAFSTSGRADMIVLNQAGQLAVWRSDTADTFTKCSDCVDAAVASRSFTALVTTDFDGKLGADLIAVDGQGVTVLLNDGQGKLKAVNSTVSQMPMAAAFTLGDIDNDAKPDLVLNEAATGKLWLWLNQSDGAAGDGKLAGPVAAVDLNGNKAITVGVSGLVALDGTTPADRKQRLITTDLIAKKLVSWQNATQP